MQKKKQPPKRKTPEEELKAAFHPDKRFNSFNLAEWALVDPKALQNKFDVRYSDEWTIKETATYNVDTIINTQFGLNPGGITTVNGFPVGSFLPLTEFIMYLMRKPTLHAIIYTQNPGMTALGGPRYALAIYVWEDLFGVKSFPIEEQGKTVVYPARAIVSASSEWSPHGTVLWPVVYAGKSWIWLQGINSPTIGQSMNFKAQLQITFNVAVAAGEYEIDIFALDSGGEQVILFFETVAAAIQTITIPIVQDYIRIEINFTGRQPSSGATTIVGISQTEGVDSWAHHEADELTMNASDVNSTRVIGSAMLISNVNMLIAKGGRTVQTTLDEEVSYVSTQGSFTTSAFNNLLTFPKTDPGSWEKGSFSYVKIRQEKDIELKKTFQTFQVGPGVESALDIDRTESSSLNYFNGDVEVFGINAVQDVNPNTVNIGRQMEITLAQIGEYTTRNEWKTQSVPRGGITNWRNAIQMTKFARNHLQNETHRKQLEHQMGTKYSDGGGLPTGSELTGVLTAAAGLIALLALL